jgi:hypothetical protein
MKCSSRQFVDAFKLMSACCILGQAICGDASLAQAQGTNTQHIDNPDGSLFMEEVQSNRKDQQGSRSAPRVEMKRPPDLSELGVPMNSQGHIVPLIDHDAGPVMEMGTSTSVTTEPLPYAYSYGPYMRARMGNYPYYNPYYNPYYGGPSYGIPVPPYGGYPYGYGYGYGPAANLNLNLGKVRLNIGAGNYYGNGYGPWRGSPLATPSAVSPLLSPYVAGGASGPYTGSRTPLNSGGYYGGYIPMMYSSSGMGGYSFNSSGSGTGFPLGYNYNYQSGGGLLSPLMH